MLGKLIKYEFKHTSKTMLTTFIVLALATAMGSFGLYRLNRLSNEKTLLSIVGVIMLVIYIIALIGVYCGDFIYLCYHYHKTMYSSQGYLTHTLPVSPSATLGAKVLVFFIWMLISTILLMLSGIVLLQVGSDGQFLREFAGLSWEGFSRDLMKLFGFSANFFLFIVIIAMLLNILYYVLFITASMAIGQLFQKGRTGFSILAGFIIYTLNQIVNTIYMAVSGYSTGLFLEGNLKNFMRKITIGSLGITVLFLIVLYGICIMINKKKLNLE